MGNNNKVKYLMLVWNIDVDMSPVMFAKLFPVCVCLLYLA